VATVVDIGCGTGLMSIGLRERGAFVVGVDNSSAMLARALGRRRIDSPIKALAHVIPLERQSADAVIVAAILHLHADPSSVIREALRIVKPGGPVVVTSPVPDLSPARMYGIDRLHGRGAGSAAVAHLLRLWVGIQGSRSRGPVAARARGIAEVDVAAELRASQANTPGFEIRSLGVVGGAQRLWVLRGPAAIAV
jgi:SAM-dependent methyltransferase